ncbi:MAG TPA: CvpA family protein [Actinomycetota bacterium]|nr:CvpA family protein [Actinomycetota bacterium]
MSRSLTLDIVVVLTIVFACLRGWAHRSLREAATIAGFGIGVVVAMLAAGPSGTVVDALGPDRHVATAIAAIFFVCLGAAAGAIWGARWAKRLPGAGPRVLDAIGGAALGVLRSLLVVALVLYGLNLAFGPATTGAKMVTGSVSGRFLADRDSPFVAMYDAVFRSSGGLRELRNWAKGRYEPDVGYRSTELEATDARLVVASEAEQEMFDLVNKERRKHGLSPLRWCEACAEVARKHSKDMYRNGYFAHVDLSGHDPFDRMRAAGIGYASAGENLAIAPTVMEAHLGLMGSPDHRRNILRPTFDEAGIGIYDGPYGLMCTQVFRELP